jgi:RHS repeat-associated protein
VILEAQAYKKSEHFLKRSVKRKAKSDFQKMAQGYTFGFNGQEKDNEIKGMGNSVNFKYRMEDTRIGRFFAVDPLTSKYPELTPYQVAGNTPIEARELEGLEPNHCNPKPSDNPEKVKAFYSEMGDLIANTVTNLTKLALSTETQRSAIKQVDYAVNNPIETGKKIINSLEQWANNATSSDPQKQGKAEAQLVFGVVTALTPLKNSRPLTTVIESEAIVANSVINSFVDIVANPKALWGKSADEVGSILGEGWTPGTYASSKTGWKFTNANDGQSVFYHPGGGRHGGSYYGFSSGTLGKTKIVGTDYIPLKGDKATIIKIGN